MEEKDIWLEKEGNAPSDWQTNTIFERDGKGNLVEIFIVDDEPEVSAYVAND